MTITMQDNNILAGTTPPIASCWLITHALLQTIRFAIACVVRWCYDVVAGGWRMEDGERAKFSSTFNINICDLNHAMNAWLVV